MTTDTSQLRLQALDYMNDGVMIADLDGQIIYTDPALALMFGSDPAQFDNLKTLAERVQLERGQSFLTALEQMQTGEPWLAEAIGSTAEGKARLLEMRGTLLKNSAGQPMAGMFVARDITRERSLEKQVLQSQQMELVENLSIGIAHEFKNLLTIIIAYASILQDQMADSDLRADILKIQEAAQAANDLAARLLAITRRNVPVMEEVDLQDVLNDLVAMLKKTLPANIQLFAPEKFQAPTVRIDRAILYRALLNLCLNARDAMPDGGKLTIELDLVNIERVDLTHWPDRLPGTYITLSVTDTGCGMAPEIKQRIFEPFFTTKRNGTGLGLTVVQHTIRAMGGWVAVYSEPGLGSCFRLYIPALEQMIPLEEEAPGVATLYTGTETVLVVDDDPLSLNVAQRLLQKAGYKVWVAPGGEEAIQLYKEHGRDFDLVLLDVVMPYANGEDVYREMAKLNPDVTVLLVSGFTPRTAERLISVSGARFISKPFTQTSLARAVREVLDNRPFRGSAP